MSKLLTGYPSPRMKISAEKNPEKYTVNTDKVEREIRKLREEKRQLEQQIPLAARFWVFRNGRKNGIIT